MVQFRPAAERGRFDPPVVEDFSQAMSADSQRRIAQLAEANRQQERLLQQEVENAKRTTQNDAALQTLATFSKTAAAAVMANAEQTAKDIQDGEDWNFLFGNDNPQADLAEDVASTAADMQLQQTSDAAKSIEAAYKSPALADEFYKRNAGIGKGLQNERMMLIQARTDYPSFLMSYRDSDKQITIPGLGTDSARNWLESNNPAVVAAVHQQARYDFIKSRGLQYATKRAFVKEFGNSALAAEGNAATNILNNNSKRNRQVVVDEIVGLASATAASEGFSPGTYNQFVKDLANAGSGKTVGQADKLIAAAYISAFENAGNEDALHSLLGQYRRFNEDGTPIKGTRFGDTPELAGEIRDAIDRVERRDRKQRTDKADELIAEARNALESAESVEDANAIAAEYAPRIRAQDRSKADTFIKNQEGYRIDDNEALNAQYLLDEQASGFFRSDAYYQDVFNKGGITRATLKSLQDGNDEKKLPTSVKNIVSDLGSVYKTRIAQGAGLRMDTSLPQPIFKKGSGKWSTMSVAEATELSKQYNAELRKVAVAAYNNAPPGASEAEKIKLAQDAIKRFNETEVVDKNGAYNFDALNFINYNSADPSTKGVPLQFVKGTSDVDKAAATNLYRKLKQMPAARYAAELDVADKMGKLGGQPVPWFNTYEPGTAPSNDMTKYYSARRGDKVFTQDVVMEYQRIAVDEHRIDDNLRATAEGLKVNPLMLLNQQLNAYGLTNSVVYPTDLTKDTETKAIPQEGDWVGGDRPVSDQVFTGQGGPYEVADQGGSGQMTPWQGSQWFMRAGFSPRGAAYLSGNIQTESGWIPDRPAWDDVGAPAGGLVSWRGQRLLQLEQEYGGTQVQYLTTEQQLQYMLKELSKPEYKVAYDIFMDPRSTQRDLIYASKYFWGYGVEGDRYQQAEEIIRQMKARGQL